MDRFKNSGVVSYRGKVFNWLVTDKNGIHGSAVYFGLSGNSGIGGPAHLANRMSVEDAEAIGYSLLAAAKAAREANE